MRAIVITRQGRPVADNVTLVDDFPDPVPGPGELLVRTEASALNHLDIWVGAGLPGIDRPFPRITGSDGCGRVEAVGDGVDEAWIGRRVVLNAAVPIDERPRPDAAPAPRDISMIGEHVHGTLAEIFVAPAANVLALGDDTDPVHAAAYALSHLTAWRMLDRARLRAGHWVLIPGIGGGVALAVLGLAKRLGCRAIVTSRHEWKLDRAAVLGADHGVLDTGEDWSRAVRGFTGKRGVDVCADSVGKAIHLSCIKSLARGGAFVTCGCTTGPDAVTDLARIFWNQLTIVGSTMGTMDEFRAAMAVHRAGLEPVIDGVQAPADAAAAYARMETGEQFGKIVVRW